jgi:hypothetical protein
MSSVKDRKLNGNDGGNELMHDLVEIDVFKVNSSLKYQA